MFKLFLFLTTARHDYVHRFHGQQPVGGIQDQLFSIHVPSYLDCYNQCILHPVMRSLGCSGFVFDENQKTCTIFTVPASGYEAAAGKDLYVYGKAACM